MNDIPGLRLAPTRMIALVGQGGRQLDSVSPKSTPAERHAAGWSGPRVLAAKPLDVTERTITNADTTPAMQTRVARFTPDHSEPIGDADGVPEIELSFGDFLDLINPLHHIPFVGMIYRAITGDEIGAPAKIWGGLLFGGPIGFITSIFDAIVAEVTGRDLGATVMAALFDRDEAPVVQVADARDLEGISIQEGISVQDDAPEDSPPTANGAPGPVSGHRNLLGHGRSMAVPIPVTVVALTPVAPAPAPEWSAAPGARPPARNAWPLAAATPSPQAATVPGIGLDRIRIDRTRIAGSIDPVNPVAINRVDRIHAVDGIAVGDSNQPRSALGEKPFVPVAPGPDASPVPVAASTPVVVAKLISAGAPKPGNQRFVPSVATTGRGFAERMLEGLDKYRALASERYRDNGRATRRLDLNL